MTTWPADEVLDARDKHSPRPTLMAKEFLSRMKNGHILKIMVADPANLDDLAIFCGRSGDELLGRDTQDRHTNIYIRKVDPQYPLQTPVPSKEESRG